MLELNGINLPQRQKELNAKVKETVLLKYDFDKIKKMKEKSDVDRLFKIDVASKYQELTYILETFVCGDPLYISRALKSVWLFSDDYASIINPEYLHNNMFISMSAKMIKKVLTTISIHVREQERAQRFYVYCLENKYNNIAMKFLLFTSHQNKIEYIHSVDRLDDSLDLAHFIGNSFVILETYLQKLKASRQCAYVMYEQFCHLYSYSNNKYLNLIETYSCQIKCRKLGLRMSKDIITKHKQRLQANLDLYLRILNINVLKKYSTVDEVKFYFRFLLPSEVQTFWIKISSQSIISALLERLPEQKRYYFLRESFVQKYPEEQFESSVVFIENEVYLHMNAKDREAWVLKYLKYNSDYSWCKYVKFETAFEEIKKQISITNSSAKRTELVKVLINAARKQTELEVVLNYYYDRHSNEKNHYRIEFLDAVCNDFNVFKLDENCWKALDKILDSLDVYNKNSVYDNLRTLSIIYHILNNKVVPETLQVDIITEARLHYFKFYQKKLTKVECNLLYQYYITLYTNKLERLDNIQYKKKNKNEIRELVSYVILIFKHFNKSKHNYPDIVMKYINLDRHYFSEKIVNKEISQDILIRQLKKDCNGVIEKLPDLKKSLLNPQKLQLTRLMRKIKIYFSNDIAKHLLSVFESWLMERQNIWITSYNTIICSIFHIATEDYIVNFMAKYAPTMSKIAHGEIDLHVFRIQECICRFVQYSRPPVPLPDLLKYLQGDYVLYCLPLFNAYTMKLPRPLLIQFTMAIIDAPVSLQKHGLRIAFTCFNVKELEKLLLRTWSKTKNASLRKVLYENLFERVADNTKDVERLYKILKRLTLDLNEYGDEDIFILFSKVSLLPTPVVGDFLQVIWKAADKLSDQRLGNSRKKCIAIRALISKFHAVDKEFVRDQIIEKFLIEMFLQRKIRKRIVNEDTKLTLEKWELAAKYIVCFDPEQMNKSLELLSIIIKEGTEMWNYVGDGNYTIRHYLTYFLDAVLLLSYRVTDKCNTIPILKFILTLLDPLPNAQIYMLLWRYNLAVISKSIMYLKGIGSKEISYDHLKEEQIAADFTNEFAYFLSMVKDKGMLYGSMYGPLALQIETVLGTITYGTTLNRDSIVLYTCDCLASVDMVEAVAIATLMLPTQDNVQDKHKKLLSQVGTKISKSKHQEVQAALNNKIAENEYKLY